MYFATIKFAILASEKLWILKIVTPKMMTKITIVVKLLIKKLTENRNDT